MILVKITTVVVRVSWHLPPFVSLVSAGPRVVKLSKSSLILHTAENKQHCKFKSLCKQKTTAQRGRIYSHKPLNSHLLSTKCTKKLVVLNLPSRKANALQLVTLGRINKLASDMTRSHRLA